MEKLMQEKKEVIVEMNQITIKKRPKTKFQESMTVEEENEDIFLE